MANAKTDVNALYNPAVGQIQAQIPAIQNLYATLVQGLQNQATTQGANLMQSAQQRGVATPAMGADINNVLGQALAQQSAVLGAQQAQGVAGLQGQVGQANVDRAGTLQQFQTSNLKDSLEAQSNRYQMSDLERQASLREQGDRQDFEIRKARFEKQEADRRAREAQARRQDAQKQASFSLMDMSKSDIDRVMRVGLNKVTGEDGYVSPEDLARAYND